MEEKRPRLTDLRDSGTIEEDCGMLILLHPLSIFMYIRTEREMTYTISWKAVQERTDVVVWGVVM